MPAKKEVSSLTTPADHAPARSFLTETIGYFGQDPKLFLVQTPHFFINPNPIERNLRVQRQTPSESDLFFGAVLPGLDSWGAAYFCGSAAVLRQNFGRTLGLTPTAYRARFTCTAAAPAELEAIASNYDEDSVALLEILAQGVRERRLAVAGR